MHFDDILFQAHLKTKTILLHSYFSQERGGHFVPWENTFITYIKLFETYQCFLNKSAPYSQKSNIQYIFSHIYMYILYFYI